MFIKFWKYCFFKTLAGAEENPEKPHEEEAPEEKETHEFSGEEEEREEEPHPKEGSKRWKEIYWKAKEGERAAKKVAELEEVIQHIRENFDKRINGIETKTVKDDIDSQIEMLKQQAKHAMEDADLERYDSIRDQIEDLKIEKKIKSASSHRSKPKESMEEDSATAQQVAIELFRAQNPWFDEKEEMREFAIDTERMLRLDPKWKNKNYSQLLAEVSRRTKRMYGYDKSSKHSGVEGFGAAYSRREAESPAELNEQQKKVARNFWPELPPKEAYKKYMANLQEEVLF